MTTPSGTVTRWIPKLKSGDAEAQAWLLARYYQRVVAAAGERLRSDLRRARDEDDVAAEVFHQFLERARNNGFRKLEDRTDLEEILLLLTQRRATDSFRSATARQRFELGESALGQAADAPVTRAIDAHPAPASDPETALTRDLAETIRHLFRSIECQDLKLEEIALLRLQGYSADEIADQIGERRRTVYRRLELIRERWQQSLEADITN